MGKERATFVKHIHKATDRKGQIDSYKLTHEQEETNRLIQTETRSGRDKQTHTNWHTDKKGQTDSFKLRHGQKGTNRLIQAEIRTERDKQTHSK